METEGFNEKQQTELNEYDEKQRRRFENGKRLVYLIAGLNIASDIIIVFVNQEFQLFKFVIHVALSIALVCGIAWVRYLYIVSGILTILATILALPELVDLMHYSAVSGIYMLVLLLIVCYAIAMVVILLFSKSVKEYMYQKKSARL